MSTRASPSTPGPGCCTPRRPAGPLREDRQGVPGAVRDADPGRSGEPPSLRGRHGGVPAERLPAGVAAALDGALGAGSGARWSDFMDRARDAWDRSRRPLLEDAAARGPPGAGARSVSGGAAASAAAVGPAGGHGRGDRRVGAGGPEAGRPARRVRARPRPRPAHRPRERRAPAVHGADLRQLVRAGRDAGAGPGGVRAVRGPPGGVRLRGRGGPGRREGRPGGGRGAGGR